MMSRKKALKLVKNCSKYSHLLLASKLMKRLAEKLGEDSLEWELVGLLHDLDFDEVRNDMSRHGVLAAERLKDKLPEHCIYAIKAHDSARAPTRQSTHSGGFTCGADGRGPRRISRTRQARLQRQTRKTVI
jgi:putative nucleotidyltransferase with HDIG domain